jgi:hypothetical protein
MRVWRMRECRMRVEDETVEYESLDEILRSSETDKKIEDENVEDSL